MPDWPSLGDYNGHFMHDRLAVGGCPHPHNVPAFVAAGIRGIIDARPCMLREHIIYIAHLPASITWKILGIFNTKVTKGTKDSKCISAAPPQRTPPPRRQDAARTLY